MPKRPTIYDLNITDGGALVFTPITFSDGDATPLVDGGNVFRTANTTSTTITDFLNGAEGQEIEIKVDENTTIQHNSSILLEGGSDFVGIGTGFVGSENAVIKLRLYSGVWLQTAPACITGIAPSGPPPPEETSPAEVFVSPTPEESPSFVPGSPITETLFGRTDSRPSPATESNQSGYINYNNTFETWVGRQVMATIDYGVGNYGSTVTEASSMASMVNPSHMYGWRYWRAQVPGRVFCLQFPCVTNRVTGNRWQRVANGDFDSYYRTFADNLVAHDMEDIDISLAWEMDGTWFAWHAEPGSSESTYFAAGCRQIIDVMRAQQPSATWHFGITVACANSSVNSVPYLTLVYPGDSYVDWLGLDLYDYSGAWYTSAMSQATKITNYVAHVKAVHFGFLDTWRNFAFPRGKQLTFPEWGVKDMDDGHGGDDNPNFIQDIADYMATYPGLFKWHSYYDHVFGGGTSKLSPTTTCPNAAQKFLDVF